MSRSRGRQTAYSAGPGSAFESEKYLVSVFCEALSSQNHPWGEVSATVEFGYIRGRTDVVVVEPDSRVMAFEAKLADWRGALQQAYRNTCFAHASFVIFPKPTALHASKFSHEFQQRGVGICYLEEGKVVVLRDADSREPIQPWLASQAAQAALDDGQ